MLYLSLNPSDIEKQINEELLIKYNFKKNTNLELIFNLALQILTSEINSIGLKNILTNEISNKKFIKIHKTIYYKKSENLKMLYTTNYLKESFFKKYKKNINLILKEQLLKEI